MEYKNNRLSLDGVFFEDICSKHSTPTYVYSQDEILSNINSYKINLDSSDLVCFSVKSSNNLHILKLISSQGLGFDVVSGGELNKALYINADTNKIVFSGVGKTEQDLTYAIKNNIKSINVESLSELQLISKIVSELNTSVNVALRLNPEIKSKTHPYLETGSSESKFGIAKSDLVKCVKLIKNQNKINLKGLAFHIGSEIKDFSYFMRAIKFMLDQIKSLNMDKPIEFLDVGGGLAIKYFDNDKTLSIEEFVKKVRELVPNNINLIFEPGKSIIGNAGYLMSKVLYKKKNILIIDAGMNDHIRTPLYGAKHNILPVRKQTKSKNKFIVVGPICESADYFDKKFSYNLNEGELVVIGSSGAYGFSMVSNYNARLKPPEVIVLKNGKTKLIRKRETFDDFISEEVGLE
jgi:diaminopimelate decarboxylase